MELVSAAGQATRLSPSSNREDTTVPTMLHAALRLRWRRGFEAHRPGAFKGANMNRRGFVKTLLASAPAVWVFGQQTEATEPKSTEATEPKSTVTVNLEAPGVTLVAHEGWTLAYLGVSGSVDRYELIDDKGYSRGLIYLPLEGTRWKTDARRSMIDGHLKSVPAWKWDRDKGSY